MSMTVLKAMQKKNIQKGDFVQFAYAGKLRVGIVVNGYKDEKGLIRVWINQAGIYFNPLIDSVSFV